jgi:ubiquinone/menaquinone biosynthesis C-methylase UbiE
VGFDEVDETATAQGFEPANVRRSYDAVAADYAATFGDELAGKPLDCRLLDDLVTLVGPDALVIDLGCGPGQVGERLAAAGTNPVGIDLAPGMLAIGRQRRAAAGDLRAIPLRDGSAAGAVAFYCLHHLPIPEIERALVEIRRVLQPSAPLLVATHLGEGALHASEWFGHPVCLSGARYPRPLFEGTITDAGFTMVERHERDPDPEEAPTTRLYLLARAPG